MSLMSPYFPLKPPCALPKLIREEEWLAMAYVFFGRFLISDLFGSWTMIYHQHGPVSPQTLLNLSLVVEHVLLSSARV